MVEVVYVLTNPAMPELVKIGRTENAIETRMKQLDGTGTPLPFECFYAAEVSDFRRVEKALHEAFDDHRIRKSREFFRLSPEKPRAIIRLLEQRDVTPRDDVVESADDAEALNRARRRRSNFRFSFVDIAPGSILESVFDESITCEVIDDRKVRFRGEVASLSVSALEVAHDSGFNWVAIQGPSYWKYHGRTLSEIRSDIEDDDGDTP